MYIRLRLARARAQRDRNQSTTDRRFYSHCAAINDDSAKRNKTSLRYLLHIGTARYVGMLLEAILATALQRRIAPSRFFTIDSLAPLAAFVPPRARRYLRPSFASTLRTEHKPAQIFAVTVFQWEINASFPRRVFIPPARFVGDFSCQVFLIVF